MDLPHYKSEKRPPMPIKDRAAQFAPFAALTGFEGVIAETGRLTDSPAELDEDEKAKIDRVLQLLLEKQDTQPRLTAVVYRPDKRKQGGSYERITGAFKGFDPYTASLLLTDGTQLPVQALYDLEICR